MVSLAGWPLACLATRTIDAYFAGLIINCLEPSPVSESQFTRLHYMERIE